METSVPPKKKVQGRVKKIPIRSATGQIADAPNTPWTHHDRENVELVVQQLAEKIMKSDELHDLVTHLAWYRSFNLRGMDTPPVSVEQSASARKDAIKFLSLGLFADALPEDIQFAERVRDVKLSTVRPLSEVPQGTLPDGRECSVFERGDEIPTEPWERMLIDTFQGVGLLPLADAWTATKWILENIVHVGGSRPVPQQFVMALEAMERADSVAGIREVDVEHRRIADAIKFIEEDLYDPNERVARITFRDSAGGGWMRAWGAAVRFAACFDVRMPLKPSAALRDRSKRQA